MLKAGIVGLPNVGKSTLFNALTKSNALAANYAFATIEPNIGTVLVKDERLEFLTALYETKRVIPTSFEFIDIAGLVKGASKGEGLGNQFLAHIREVDAICQVVRCFESTNVVHVEGKVDPLADLETINLELTISDLDVVDKRIAKIAKKAQSKIKEAVFEYDLLTKVKSCLELEKSLLTLDLTKEENFLIKSFNLLTLKPQLIIANISDSDLKEPCINEHYAKLLKYAQGNNFRIIPICIQLESEIANLADDEKQIFLEEYGIKTSKIDELIKMSYELLGLKTYFTAGVQEVRAWTFTEGMKAPQCAGIIHSDFERGFIKAETISYEDLKKYGTLQNAKQEGRLRLEGKEYIVKDGDVMLFRFNV